MTSFKHTGSYYTPDFLSGFIMGYVVGYFNAETCLSVLEPSVGDGSFVKSFFETTFPESIGQNSFTAVEKDGVELKKAEQIISLQGVKNVHYTFIEADFLEYQKNLGQSFRLIVGNPPYIKKQLLTEQQIKLCEEIHSSASLSPTSVKNIWSAFLVRCCQLLTNDGILAFVLPAELLQVNFSAELRTYLRTVFQRTEIFTFSDLLFDCKGQDTVLLIGFKKHKKPGQFYTHISDIKQLRTNDFTLVQNNALVSTNTKWTHHLLPSDDLALLYNINSRLNKVDDYCESKPGIVTAGNRFFIVNEEVEKKYNLSNYTRPIILKGLFVNGSVTFSQNEYDNIVKEGKPSKVLVINDSNAGHLPESVQEYIDIGASQEFSTAYKCSKRENWFVIPNISTVPDGFFFRRTHHYPKMLKNEANVLVTDSAYKIEMRNGYNINHLIYSFYNSLTLAFAELDGRYYGGGVLELTPQEFKKLPVPFVAVSEVQFEGYTNFFEAKNDITDVLKVSDFQILHSTLQMNLEEIENVRAIYNKLVTKRFRKKAK